MTARPHEELEELLGAYALDAVEADEAELVEFHLEDCPRCQAEVDASRDLAAWLATAALAGTDDAPPPGLWSRIAGRLEAAPRPVPPGPQRPAARTAYRRPGRWWTSPAVRWASVTVAAAAVVVAVVLGVDLSGANGQLGRADRALGGHESHSAVAAALAQPGHRLVRLDSPGGTRLAEFVVAPGGQGFLVSSSMPALPAGETYQLWAVVSGRPISMGLLGRHPERASFTVASGPAPSLLAVTVEPATGAVAPTASPVASGRIVPA